MSTTAPVSKYILRPLEEEIELFDRKLAHLLKFDVFPTEEDRQAAATKLTAKRERVVRTIRQLTEPTVEDAPQPLLVTSKKTTAKSKSSAKAKTPAKPGTAKTA